jgi:hypothetical protein
MSHPVYLITGPSGSGKTEIANYLNARGQQAIDIDSTPGLCFFVDKNNRPVPYPQGADSSWWKTHNYVWELDRLRKLIDTIDATGPVFLCGNAGNISKAWPMFTSGFFLDIPADIMIQRIAGGRRDHSFGQRVDEPEQLMRWAEPFKAEMIALGVVVIDATTSVDKIADTILQHVQSGNNA